MRRAASCPGRFRHVVGPALCLAAGLAVLLAALPLPRPAGGERAAVVPYGDGPPPAHTGGFGEPTCHVCHFDRPRDPPGGELTVRACVPTRPPPAGPTAVAARERRAAPGRPGHAAQPHALVLVVTLRHPALRRAGFQLAVRRPHDGVAAGALHPLDDGVEVVAHDGVPYAQHTAAGTAPSGPGVARWRVGWRGGREVGRAVVHVAANAANDDASELGDRIYAVAWEPPATPSSCAATGEVTGDEWLTEGGSDG